jgi:hypothetical protein
MLEQRCLLAADTFEPNDSFAQAWNVGRYDQFHQALTIDASGDDDWYRWTPWSGGIASASIFFDHESGNLDIEVYNAARNILTSSKSNTDNEIVLWAAVTGDTYYVRVFGADGNTHDDYDLSLNQTGVFIDSDAFEQNDTYTGATNLKSGDQQHKSLTLDYNQVQGITDTADWYRWTSLADGRLSVGVSFRHTLGDIGLQLYEPPTDVSPIGKGIAIQDNATGRGFVMYSEESVQTRFASVPPEPGNSDHFIGVRFVNGQWQYDNNRRYVAFVPRTTDLLVAAVDFDADSIIMLQGITGQTSGIARGFFAGDLQGLGDRWDGGFNDGEFTIQGTHFLRNAVASSTSAADLEQVAATVSANKSYLIRAYGINEGSSPGYDLTINGPELAADAFEPNDTSVGAFDLITGSHSFTGLTIHAPNNDDWYKWTAPSHRHFSVSVAFQHDLGNLDLELYNANRVLVASSRSMTDLEHIERDATPGESYYIRVYGIRGETNRYNLGIDGGSIPPDSYEPNDNFALAYPLNSADVELASASIHQFRNEDWYRWMAPATGPLTIDMAFPHVLANLDVELFDSAQRLLARSNSMTNNERITWSVNRGDTYFIRVISVTGTEHPRYTFTLDGPEPGRIIVTPTSGLITTEAGGTASFAIALGTEPAAEVTIPLSSSNPSEGVVSPDRLTFTRGNWNVPQSVTVTGVDDPVADGDINYTIVTGPATGLDPNYNGLDLDDVEVTNRNDSDTAGVRIQQTDGSMTVAEGDATDRYSIVLTSRPFIPVVITIAPDNQLTVSPTIITFAPDNWDVPQVVTVAAIDDKLDESDPHQGLIRHTASARGGDVIDPAYDRIPIADVVVAIGDRKPQFPLLPNGEPNDEHISLGYDQSTGKLTFDAVGQQLSTLHIRSNSGIFTGPKPPILSGPLDVYRPQEMFIRAPEGIGLGYLDFGNVATPGLTKEALLNDLTAVASEPSQQLDLDYTAAVTGITVSPTEDLLTTEAGDTDTFSVVLDQQPTATVRIPLASSSTANGVVFPDHLEFTIADWNVPQTVVVTGVDDPWADADAPFRIDVGAATSSDAFYNGLDPADVSVTSLNDDFAEVQLSSDLLQVSERGATDSYTVSLLSPPRIGNVIVRVQPDDQATVSSNTLTFTSSDWNIPQTVVVTAVDDEVTDQPTHIGVINHIILGNESYDGLTVDPIAVAIADNDHPQLIRSVKLSTTAVCAGEPTLVDTELTDNTLNVSINLAPGKTRYLQFEGEPGKRHINVSASTPDGAVDEWVGQVELIACNNRQFPIVVGTPNRFHQNVLDLDVVNSSHYSTGLTPVEYFWRFGDGATAQTTVPFVSHDYSAVLDNSRLYTLVDAEVTVRRQGLDDISGKRTISLGNTYALGKSRGTIHPTIVTDGMLARTQDNYIGEYTIHNLEDEPLQLTSRQLEYQACDKTADIRLLNPEQVDVHLGPHEKEKQQTIIPAVELPADVCGVAVHMTGTTQSQVDASVSAYFDVSDHAWPSSEPIQDEHMRALLSAIIANKLVPNPNRITEEDLVLLARAGKIVYPPDTSDSLAGDFNQNGLLDVDDLDRLSGEVRRGGTQPTFDLNDDSMVDQRDRNIWVVGLFKTYLGDSNLDGVFNTSDLVDVFVAGEYEDAVLTNSTWATGDWNGDGEFDSGDLVHIFQAGGFEKGPLAAVGSRLAPEFMKSALAQTNERGPKVFAAQPVEGMPCSLSDIPETDHWVCSVVDFVPNQSRVPNAHKGEILLVSSCSAVGVLLRNVSPPQLYTHEGIMLDNFFTVAHSTFSVERAAAYRKTHGVKEDAIKYGWPGPISQSISNAFNGEKLYDPYIKHFGKHYKIDGFGSEPQRCRSLGDRMNSWPLVVKPPKGLDINTEQEVRDILWQAAEEAHRVAADASSFYLQPSGKEGQGHYRWYAFTDGNTGFPPCSGIDDHETAGVCVANVPKGLGAWADGTVPSVSTTFIRDALRIALTNTNRHLEGNSLEPGDKGSLPTKFIDTEDGLYYYNPQERLRAGNALHDYLKSFIIETYKAQKFWAGNVVNQLLSSLALDIAERRHKWQDIDDPDYIKAHPRAGVSVSAEDFLNWDNPTERGVYGDVEPLFYEKGVIRPIMVWKLLVEGDASRKPISGHVYRGGVPEAGATVVIDESELKTPTDFQGAFGTRLVEEPVVREHKIEAYKVINGVRWSSGQRSLFVPNEGRTNVRLTLQPESTFLRQVDVSGAAFIEVIHPEGLGWSRVRQPCKLEWSHTVDPTSPEETLYVECQTRDFFPLPFSWSVLGEFTFKLASSPDTSEPVIKVNGFASLERTLEFPGAMPVVIDEAPDLPFVFGWEIIGGGAALIDLKLREPGVGLHWAEIRLTVTNNSQEGNGPGAAQEGRGVPPWAVAAFVQDPAEKDQAFGGGEVDTLATLLRPGDANLDGRFDSFDIFIVIQAGLYETGQRATWREGDWDGDGEFDSTDLVHALKAGPYEKPPAALHDLLFRENETSERKWRRPWQAKELDGVFADWNDGAFVA